MTRALWKLVRERAGCRCEYCHLHESAAPASTFHLEHVVAKQHAGSDDPANCAWSCRRCNYRKGPNLSGKDPLTGNIVRLFDPRRQSWARHFKWLGALLAGRTQCGRATIAVLDINHPDRLKLRQTLIGAGEWPDD